MARHLLQLLGRMLAHVPTDAFEDFAIQTAKRAIIARHREKKFVRHDMIQQIMKAAAMLAAVGTQVLSPSMRRCT